MVGLAKVQFSPVGSSCRPRCVQYSFTVPFDDFGGFRLLLLKQGTEFAVVDPHVNCCCCVCVQGLIVIAHRLQHADIRQDSHWQDYHPRGKLGTLPVLC